MSHESNCYAYRCCENINKKEEAEIEKAINSIYAASAKVPFKPFPDDLRSRSEWLNLLHRLQNGDATCMFVLNEIEKEINHENQKPTRKH